MNDLVERLRAALADRYRIERELGQGGMATVYLAEDLKHDRKVALKVLRARAGRGARRRAVRAGDHDHRRAAAPAHPAAVRLRHRRRLPLLRHAVHRRRDAARRSSIARRSSASTRRCGSPREVADALRLRAPARRDPPRHQAREHPAARRPADGGGLRDRAGGERGGRRADDRDRAVARHAALHEPRAGDGGEGDHEPLGHLLARRACCTRCSTGEPPHTGASAQQIIMKIITEEARPVTELRKSVPPNVGAAVAKALEKLPADRFESAKEFAEALQGRGAVPTTAGTVALPGGKGARAAVVGWRARLRDPLMLSRSWASPGRRCWPQPDSPGGLRCPRFRRSSSSWRRPTAPSRSTTSPGPPRSPPTVGRWCIRWPRRRVRPRSSRSGRTSSSPIRFPGTANAYQPYFSA